MKERKRTDAEAAHFERHRAGLESIIRQHGRNPDRLGDAIRELARTMAENGKTSMTFHIVSPGARAVYRLDLLRTVHHRKRVRGFLVPRPGENVIEVKAFGPEPSAGSRQMADKK